MTLQPAERIPGLVEREPYPFRPVARLARRRRLLVFGIDPRSGFNPRFAPPQRFSGMRGEESPRGSSPSAGVASGPGTGYAASRFVFRNAEGESMDGYIERVSGEIADILLREGIDYAQTRAVFKAARAKAGLKAPREKRAAPARLTIEEQLRFIDAAYARGGRAGLMVQTLLETGARVSEFAAIRVEDVSPGERTIAIENGKGGRRREVPIRTELARLLSMHVGRRRSGPLFVSREKGAGGLRVYSRQRIGQMVREIAREAGIGKRIYPHLLRHTMATRLLAAGMDIADIQKFLGHADIGATRIYAETSVAMLKRKFDQVADPAGRGLLGAVRERHGEVAGAFAADLLSGDRRSVARAPSADA